MKLLEFLSVDAPSHVVFGICSSTQYTSTSEATCRMGTVCSLQDAGCYCSSLIGMAIGCGAVLYSLRVQLANTQASWAW